MDAMACPPAVGRRGERVQVKWRLVDKMKGEACVLFSLISNHPLSSGLNVLIAIAHRALYRPRLGRTKVIMHLESSSGISMERMEHNRKKRGGGGRGKEQPVCRKGR